MRLGAEVTGLGWEGEDWGRGDSSFQGIKSRLFSQAPEPSLGFVGEGIEGAGDIGEVADELPIEVHKAKEGLDLLCLCQGRPFHDSADLHQIHGNMVFQDDQSKVLNLCSQRVVRTWQMICQYLERA